MATQVGSHAFFCAEFLSVGSGDEVIYMPVLFDLLEDEMNVSLFSAVADGNSYLGMFVVFFLFVDADD